MCAYNNISKNYVTNMVYIYDTFIVDLHPFGSLIAPFYIHCTVIAWKRLSRMFFNIVVLLWSVEERNSLNNISKWWQMMTLCVCVCACERVWARVRACARVRVWVCACACACGVLGQAVQTHLPLSSSLVLKDPLDTLRRR